MTLHHPVKNKRVTVQGPVKKPQMDCMSHRGVGITPWCAVVCSWRRQLADHQILPFPLTLYPEGARGLNKPRPLQTFIAPPLVHVTTGGMAGTSSGLPWGTTAAVNFFSSLQALNLSGNTVTDTGAIALAAALHRNDTLKELSLCNCALKDRGVVGLAEALTVNTGLQV